MPTALIVDDDVHFARAVGRMVAALGYDVIEAPNGKRGLEAAKTQRPDLALLDIFMPDKDGIQLLAEFRKLKTDMVIIVMSGGGLQNRMDMLPIAVRLGAHGQLRKPFRQADLASAIAEAGNRMSANEASKPAAQTWESVPRPAGSGETKLVAAHFITR